MRPWLVATPRLRRLVRRFAWLMLGLTAFVLLIGLLIWLLDLVLQQVLVSLIPSLFSGR